ncbi:class I adenylate-forming enzyme family protein [Streptomyces olivaceus]|uniref:class I adenylate-forming enzyme family protein n=1 Tax=Streptomyces olivaceus TaxID=47716 RepID=UPI00370060D6
MHLASLPSKRACARPDSLCLSDETVGTLTNKAFAARVEPASRVPAAHTLAGAEAEYQVADSGSRVLVTHDGLSLKGVTPLALEDLTATGAGVDVGPAAPDLDDLEPGTSSLRLVVCGAAPMPTALIGRIEERFGVVLVEGYGLSKGTCASTSNPLHGVRKPGTVGVALPGQTVAVMAPDGTLVPRGERGEVVVQGPTVMRGYLNRPEETARALENGRLHTGDVGVLDEGELVAFLTQRIAKFKLPASVTFIDEVPENSLGKSDRPRLRTTTASTSARVAGPDKETS